MACEDCGKPDARSSLGDVVVYARCRLVIEDAVHDASDDAEVIELRGRRGGGG